VRVYTPAGEAMEQKKTLKQRFSDLVRGTDINIGLDAFTNLTESDLESFKEVYFKAEFGKRSECNTLWNDGKFLGMLNFKYCCVLCRVCSMSHEYRNL
jgi:hypothetical protein